MQPLEVDEPTAVGPYQPLGRLDFDGVGRIRLAHSPGGRTVRSRQRPGATAVAGDEGPWFPVLPAI